MALSTRELYLVLRAKNEATSTLNAMAKDMEKARAAAELMGLQAQKSQLMAEQAAQRAAKAQAEYTLRMQESQKAVAQQALATEQSRSRTLAYAESMLEAQKNTQLQQKAVLEQRQALDQNAVSLLQNAKAQNELNIAQARTVAGSDDQIRAMREQNQVLQQQIIDTRNAMVARQDEINMAREQINSTQAQIVAAKELQDNQKAQVLVAQDNVHAYDEQINNQRDVVAGMRSEIAARTEQINGVNQEINDTRTANQARAETSQRLRDNGQAAMQVGTGMAIAGTVALKGAWDMTQSAVDYEKSVAQTKTQTEGLGVSMKTLGDIGLDTAKNFGVPFEDIQKSLFDIFSSMDVSVPQAQTLLNNFAKAAVAGSTDVRTAGDATIAIMNAYHIPVSQVTSVLDQQFQTVKLGRIEYEQLAGTIGRTIPSAQRAGQSYAVLGGMIALMTRNGATAANAVTAAGRAMDLFAKSDVGENLKKIGVATTDATGHFLPLTTVIPNLQKALANLNPQERAKELDALFKGSGNNIQARRFVDLVVNSKAASDQFVSFSSQIQNSSGATDKAYGTMADTMAVKSQLLKNQWQVMEITLGTILFPALSKILGGLKDMVDWLQNLSPGQQKFLAWATVISGVLLVVVGVVIALAGGFLILAAAVTAATWPVLLIIAAVAAVIAILVVAYLKVGWFHDGVNGFFNGIATVAESLWGLLVAVWNGIVECIQGSWDDIQAIWQALETATHAVGQFFVDLYNNGIKPAIDAIGTAMHWLYDNAIKPIWDGIKEVISTDWAIIQGVWEVIKAAVNVLGQVFVGLYNTFVKPYWDLIKLEIDIVWAAIQVIWGLIQIGAIELGRVFTSLYTDYIQPAWQHIQDFISQVWAWIQANVFTPIMNFIHGPLAEAWTWLSSHISAVWNDIEQIASNAWAWVQTHVFQPIIDFIHGPLATGWTWLSSHVSAVWQDIQNLLSTGWNWISAHVFDPITHAITVTIPNAFNTAVSAIRTAWQAVQDVVMTPIRYVINTVLDDHLLAGYNTLAKTFHVQPDNVQIARLADGGPVWGPGGPKADLIPAMLSNGEHVWTAAEVQAAGGQAAMLKLRRAVLNRNVDADLSRFADGGPVGASGALAGVGRDVTMMKGESGGILDWITDAASALLDPIGALSKVANGIFNEVPDAGGMKDVAVGAGKTIIDGIIAFAKSIMIPQVAGGGDLSGPQGNSIARILQWGRMFYPGAMVSSGYRPGANDYHGMGLAADLIGGGYSGMNTIAAGFYNMSGRLLEEIHNDGGAGYAVKNGARVNGASYYASVWADHANHVHIAATNEALADVGGMLQPGSNLIHNQTGGAERILSLAQTHSFERLVGLLDSRGPQNLAGLAPVGGYGGSNRPITINVTTQELDPRRHAMMLGMELDKQIAG